jgi:hypothetical protein
MEARRPAGSRNRMERRSDDDHMKIVSHPT